MTKMEKQYCCWIERRLGCIIIGFVMIIETWFTLPIHRDWDTISNSVVGVLAGVALLVGAFMSYEKGILAYLAIEIIHIVVMLISAFCAFVESSKILEDSLYGHHGSKSSMEFLGCLYFIFCGLNIYLWFRVYQFYKIFDQYALIPSLQTVE